MRVVSLIYLLMIVFSLISGVYWGHNGDGKQRVSSGLCKNNSDAVKGLLAVAVLLSHLAGQTSYHLPGFSFTVFGPIGVGCFFFLSGYGLINASRGKGYFVGYLSRHIKKLFLPFCFMFIIWVIVFQVLLNESLSDLLRSFATGNPVSNSWYIFASLYCYLLFWLGRNKAFGQMLRIVFVGIVAWILVFSVLLKWPDWWYKTIVCFYFGIIWGKYSQKISDFIQYNYVLSATMSTLAVIAAYTLPAWAGKMIGGNLLWLLNDIAMAVSGVFLMAIVVEKVSLRNTVTILLGKISFYLYLLHGLVLRLTDTLLPEWGTVDTPMHKQEFVSLMIVIVTVLLSLVMTVVTDRVLLIAFRN